jgi:AcrR family transcriptional regulator
LQLLKEREYGEVTVDAIAAIARASKAVLYPRWTTTAALVLAARTVTVDHVADSIDTGTLRSDLLALNAQECKHTPVEHCHGICGLSATGLCSLPLNRLRLANSRPHRSDSRRRSRPHPDLIRGTG